jgi:hypothetical protein
MRKLILTALLAAIPSGLAAQRMRLAGSGFVQPRPMNANGSRFAFAGFGPRHPVFYPASFFYDPFFYGDASTSGYPVSSLPPLIILQAPGSSAANSAPPLPMQPVVIELRGDRYVRISDEGSSGSAVMDETPATSRRLPNSSAPAAGATGIEEPPTAVLVFRDGHREQISSYTIADSVLYASGNYFTDGSWTRKIELSSLDLAESIRSNRSRGIRFQLPSYPNEVIVGP